MVASQLTFNLTTTTVGHIYGTYHVCSGLATALMAGQKHILINVIYGVYSMSEREFIFFAQADN